MDNQFTANSGSTVNITGGAVGGFFNAFADSTVNISGGTVGDDFDALAGSFIEIFAQGFLLDGAPIDGLAGKGDSLVLTQRGGALLTGMFFDGTPFDFTLNEDLASGDHFDPDATLRLTIIPEPGTFVLALMGAVALLAARRCRSISGRVKR